MTKRQILILETLKEIKTSINSNRTKIRETLNKCEDTENKRLLDILQNEIETDRKEFNKWVLKAKKELGYKIHDKEFKEIKNLLPKEKTETNESLNFML